MGISQFLNFPDFSRVSQLFVVFWWKRVRFPTPQAFFPNLNKWQKCGTFVKNRPGTFLQPYRTVFAQDCQILGVSADFPYFQRCVHAGPKRNPASLACGNNGQAHEPPITTYPSGRPQTELETRCGTEICRNQTSCGLLRNLTKRKLE